MRFHNHRILNYLLPVDYNGYTVKGISEVKYMPLVCNIVYQEGNYECLPKYRQSIFASATRSKQSL